MSRRGTDAFERLLTWYPGWWREANGDVLIGSLRDHAEHEGRSTPSRGEAFSAVVNGVALRLDARVALWVAVIALALSAGAWLLVLFGVAGMSTVLITAGIAPVLTLVGLIAVARSRGWMAPLRALVALVTLSSALVLAALAQLSWAQGFELAEATRAMTGLAVAWAPLVVAAWIIGGVGLALLLDGALSRTRMLWFGRLPVALLVGALIAPVIGVGLINPVMSSVVAVGVAVAALGSLGRQAAPARRVAAETPDLTRPTDGSRRAVRWLSWLSAAGGVVGVAYAFTGADWSFGATDSTVAMGQGITILLTASIPLLAAVGINASKRRGLTVVWGPLGGAVLAAVAVAIAYTAAPDWDGMWPGMALSAVLGGCSLAGWITPRLRGPFGARLAVGITVGIAYAALIGIAVIPTLAFAVPILAMIVALRARRSDHTAPSHSIHAAPAAPARAA